MKIVTLLTFLVFTALQSFAQHEPDKLLYMAKVEKYRKMKNTGGVLTMGGGVLLIGGLVTLMNSSTTTTSYSGGSPQTSSTGNAAGGFVAYLVGTACVGAGIPLWIVGGNNHRKYSRKLESVSVNLNVDPQKNGLTLSCRF
jgi:hypothetical protein